MNLSKALLVIKPTKIEYDAGRVRYRPEDADVIRASHERQLDMRARVRELLPEVRVVPRDAIDPRTPLVIALGGDNHFIFVAHALRRTPILGINADRVRSHGGLLSIDERNLEESVERLRQGRMRIQEWTRIDAFIGGRRVGTAVSEIFAGEAERKLMSRHVLTFGKRREEHRSSGMLVATGAGSTGWYGNPFKPTLKEGRWRLTEPFPGPYPLGQGRLKPGQALRLRSRNDARGILSIDSLEEVPFPYGAEAEIRVSSRPLHVAGW